MDYREIANIIEGSSEELNKLMRVSEELLTKEAINTNDPIFASALNDVRDMKEAFKNGNIEKINEINQRYAGKSNK